MQLHHHMLGMGFAVAVALWGCGKSGGTEWPATGGGQGGSGAAGTGGSSAHGGSGGAGGGSGGAGNSGGAATGGAATGGGGAAGTGGQGGAGGGLPLGAPCDYGGAPCDGGLYCEAPGCGAGTCQQIPSIGGPNQPDAVCGCDGVTYWNEAVAESRGAAVAHPGVCAAGEAVVCSDDGAAPCPLYWQRCNLEVAGAAECSSTTATGSCWGMPISCPTGGPTGCGCIDGQLYDQCSLISSGHKWYQGSC